MANQLEKLSEFVTSPGFGQALQGLGAGMAGQLPQFQQQMNQRRALEMQQQQQIQQQRQLEQQQQLEQEIERKKTFYAAAKTMQDYLNMGNFDGIINLSHARSAIGQNIPGMDTSDSERINLLARAAKNGSTEALDSLSNELEETIIEGRNLGMMAPQEDPTTDLGKATRDFQNGWITEEQYNQIAEGLAGINDYKSQTDLGALKQELDEGLITQDQYDQQAASILETEEDATYEPMYDADGNVIAQRNTKTNQVISDPRAVENIMAKQPTGAQRLAAQFAQRTTASSNIISEVGDMFVGLPSRGAGLLPQGLKSEDRQRFDQAARDFINATLRRESGAAIAQSEFDNANLQYIPQPGDSDEVLEQKRLNRETIARALQLEAGDSFNELRDSLGLVEFEPVAAGLDDVEGEEAVNSEGVTIIVRDGMWVQK